MIGGNDAGWSRREFLGAAAGCVALACVDTSLAQPAGGIRKNVNNLTPAEWATLERGVAAMKRIPTSSFASWLFQANMHGYPPNQPGPIYQGWRTCQHGNWWFLPWHRAYLLYFERILRYYSGDPSFMLPYWDWTRPDQRSLPARFLEPASPLYDGTRRPEINAGAPIPPGAVSWPTAARETTFSTPFQGRGFGSERVTNPGASGAHGAVEALCHDLVHDSIGGLMGDPATAARDPIFWLHHTNVDRLWGAWLRAGRGIYLPQESLWQSTQFLFYSLARGGAVTVSASQLLSSSALGYLYQDYPAMPATFLAMASAANPQGTAPQAAAPPSVIMAAPQERRTTIATQAPPRNELTDEPLTVTFTPDAEGKRRIEGAASPKARAAVAPGAPAPPPTPGESLQVLIDDIRFDKSPGRFYEVYVNLPGPAEATGPESPYYAGNLSFFALSADHGPHGHAMGGAAGGKTAVVDVTEVVARLRAEGKLGDDIKVTLIERSARARPAAAPGVAAAPAAAQLPRVTIGSIRLQHSGN